MRFRFAVAFLCGMVLLLSVALYNAYRSVSNYRASVREAIITPLMSENASLVDLRKHASVFDASSERALVETTRESFLPILAAGLIALLLYAAFVFGITRPLKKLSRAMEQVGKTAAVSLPRLQESGASETRSIIRAYNKMREKLECYEALMGDASRFRGWKEISRVMVHEVQNLLSPVRGYAEIAAEQLKDPAPADVILRQLSATRDLLSRFRDMAHLPAAEYAEVNIAELVRDLQHEYPALSIEETETPLVWNSDPVLLGEILRNLVKNAFELGPETRVALETWGSDGLLRMRVKDNGPGLSEQALQRIFNPGYTTKPGNAGIGLAIVKNLTQELEGSISWKSTPGLGTEFVLEFPRRPEEKR